jgi:hypothetical protein
MRYAFLNGFMNQHFNHNSKSLETHEKWQWQLGQFGRPWLS